MSKHITFVCGVFVAFGVSSAMAGDLNPPAGPVAPTMKTLTEVEPRIAINAVNTPGDADALFNITQPGSYYLTGNITGESDKAGIEITVAGVSIDLMGFDLMGVPGSLSGVRTPVVSDLDNITIRNGSVRSWGNYGIDLQRSLDTRARIMDISSSHNTQSGIRAGIGSAIARCTAAENGVYGFSVEGFGTVTDCVAWNNSAHGFQITYATVTGCTAITNGIDGFSAGPNSTVIACTATSNADDGIFAASGTIVSGCTASINDGDGIEAVGHCLIINNDCHGNGPLGGDGAGIHIRVNGFDNRIEGNNCTQNDRGIDVDAAGNFIARNTCSGNTTNWDVVAGNVCLVVSATTAGAILGNSGGAGPGSTDPNANFTY